MRKARVLIVPYGIETLILLRILVFVSIVLIVPYGIETSDILLHNL